MAPLDLALLNIGPLCQETAKEAFSSGNPIVDEYYRQEAISDMTSGYARTFVANHQNHSGLCGFYTIKLHMFTSKAHDSYIKKAFNTSPARCNSKSDNSHILGYYLRCIGVSEGIQNQSIGSFLLQDAISKIESCHQLTGGQFVAVMAGHDDPATRERLLSFYTAFGFLSCTDTGTLLLRKIN